MDNTILLQKKVRENSEDLQNFMRDMKHWETDMKRKDSELSSKSNSKEVLPPVRSKVMKKQKTSTKVIETQLDRKPKRISSYDYSSWDKFDVEKACEEVDNKNEKVETGSTDGSEPDEETRLQQQALYEKEIGNTYVKKEKWKDAIEHYTKAIKCYDKDAVFFANRALCYLKINQFKAAEDDCTKSLKLDSKYVKAYQRRAAARTSLKQYKEAEQDYRHVLKLEPNNIQAKKDLEKLKTLDKSQKPKNNSEEKSDPVKRAEVKAEVNNKDAVKEENKYPWGPVDPARILKPIYKPPHLRSKKPLNRIKITNVDDRTIDSLCNHCSTSPNKPETSTQNKIIEIVNPTTDSETTASLTNSIINKTVKVDSTGVSECSKSEILEEKTEDVVIPPPPRTSVQFNFAWKRLKRCHNSLYLYLKSINGRNLSSIFLDSMESDLFSDVILILSTEFIKHRLPVLNYIEGLSDIRRFSMLVLFMSDQDIRGIKTLIDYCISNKEITDEYALILNKKYQLK